MSLSSHLSLVLISQTDLHSLQKKDLMGYTVVVVVSGYYGVKDTVKTKTTVIDTQCSFFFTQTKSHIERKGIFDRSLSKCTTNSFLRNS